jgi:ankyrin repeat protein
MNIHTHGWDFTGCTPLMKALVDDDQPLFLSMLLPTTINVQNNQHWTALHIACQIKNVTFVKILLEHGANPDLQTDREWTALHISTYSTSGYVPSEEIVKLLLHHGANPNIQNEDGNVALMFYHDVKLLLDYGANPNIADNSGRTAMIFHTRNTTESILLLLKYGADPTIKDDSGRDLIDFTKPFFELLQLRDENKRLKDENKKQKDEIDCLYLNPLPGKEFIKLYKEEYPETTNFTEKFIEAYIPILEGI